MHRCFGESCKYLTGNGMTILVEEWRHKSLQEWLRDCSKRVMISASSGESLMHEMNYLRDCRFELTIIPFITARKRSLGQGNIFAPVCHSVHRGRGEYTGRYPPQQVHQPPYQVHPPAGPFLACTPPSSACWDTANKRAVRILLEFILVEIKCSTLCFTLLSCNKLSNCNWRMCAPSLRPDAIATLK